MIWRTALLLPYQKGDWVWTKEHFMGLPALVRILVTLHRSGIQKVFIPWLPETKTLKNQVDSFRGKKDLPDIVWWDHAEGAKFPEHLPVLVVRGGFLFAPRLIRWFHETLSGAAEGKARLGAENDLFLMLSLSSGRLNAVAGSPVSFEEVSSWIEAPSLCVPEDLFCRPIEELAKPDKDRKLLALVGKPTDRPHVVWVRRKTFPAIRQLANRGITPNQVTWGGFGIALAASFTIAQGHYLSGVLGAMLLYLSWVVDCMDGTLARLTFSESPFGQKLDSFLGHVTNLLTFGALIWAVWGHESLWKTALFSFFILGGILIVYHIIEEEKRYPRAPQKESNQTALKLFLDKVNHRDYAVVVFLFAVVNGFKVFLWLSLVGIQVFWLLRFRIFYRERQKPGNQLPGSDRPEINLRADSSSRSRSAGHE